MEQLSQNMQVLLQAAQELLQSIQSLLETTQEIVLTERRDKKRRARRDGARKTRSRIVPGLTNGGGGGSTKSVIERQDECRT